jgi:hypothetical protein
MGGCDEKLGRRSVREDERLSGQRAAQWLSGFGRLTFGNWEGRSGLGFGCSFGFGGLCKLVGCWWVVGTLVVGKVGMWVAAERLDTSPQ